MMKRKTEHTDKEHGHMSMIVRVPSAATVTKDIDGKHHVWSGFGDAWCADEAEEEDSAVASGLLREEAQDEPDEEIAEDAWCEVCLEYLEEEGCVTRGPGLGDQ